MFQFVFPQSFTKIAPFFFAPSAVWSNDNLSLVPWLVNGPWPMEGFRTFSLYWVVLNFTKICLDVRFSFFSYEPFLSFWETHLRYFLKYSLLSDFADLSVFLWVYHLYSLLFIHYLFHWFLLLSFFLLLFILNWICI